MSNLWPDFSDLKTLKMPKTILEEQAKYLVDATGGSLYGSIEEVKYFPDEGALVTTNDFDFDFFIKSKFLSGYKFKAFSIHHSIVMYPLVITVEPDIGCEIKDDIDISNLCTAIEVEITDDVSILGINSEEDFNAVLSIIFRTKKIRNVLESLISLS